MRLCLRGDLAREHARLHVELVEHRKRVGADDDESRRLADAVTALEAEMLANTTEFVFEAVGKPAWRKLMADNPPTPEDLKRDPSSRYSPEHFAMAALSESMIEPTGATVESVRKLTAKLTDTQFEILWMTCLSANEGVSGLGESRAASAVHASSERSSELHAATAPLEASSSVES